MTITKITNHVDQAIARLPKQLREKERFVNLLTVLVSPIQELEDAFWDMFVNRYADTAVGDVLDVIGRIVLQPRPSSDDDVYRKYIQAKVATIKSRGTINEFIAITKLILGEETTIIVQRQGIATVVIQVYNAGGITASLATALIGFLRKAAAGGVRLVLEVLADAPIDTFTLDSSLDSQGLDDGGSFADAFE